MTGEAYALVGILALISLVVLADEVWKQKRINTTRVLALGVFLWCFLGTIR